MSYRLAPVPLPDFSNPGAQGHGHSIALTTPAMPATVSAIDKLMLRDVILPQIADAPVIQVLDESHGPVTGNRGTYARELLHPGWFPSPPRCVAQCQSVVAHGEVSLAVLGEGVRETKVRLELSLSPSGVRQNNGDRVGMIRRSSQPASPNMRPQTLHGLGTQPDASNKSSEDEITAAAGDSDSDTSTAVDSSNGEISSTSKKLATQRIPRAPSVTEGFDARGDELRKLIKDWPMPSGAWDAGCDDGQHWPSNWLEIGIVSTNEGDRPLSRDEIRNNELRCVIKSWPVATGIWVSKDTGDARIQWPRSWAPASDLVTRGPDVDQSLAEVELQSKSQGKRRRGKRGKRGGRKRK